MRKRPAVILALTVSGCGALVGPRPPSPALVWNTTASAPVGLYGVRDDAGLRVGEWALVRPEPTLARWMDRRGYLPKGALLLKQVAAEAGEIACRHGAEVTVGSSVRAQALAIDRTGRRLPAWSSCLRVGKDQVFLLNEAPRGLDGRYFGPTPRRDVVGRAVPIFTWKGL